MKQKHLCGRSNFSASILVSNLSLLSFYIHNIDELCLQLSFWFKDIRRTLNGNLCSASLLFESERFIEYLIFYKPNPEHISILKHI